MSFNYEQPLGGPSHAHGMAVNKGWGWNWTGRERATGRTRTYYTRTSFGSKADLAGYIAHTFQGIEFIDAGPADREPLIVLSVPPHSFQGGILESIKRELQGDVRTRAPLRTLTRVRIKRS